MATKVELEGNTILSANRKSQSLGFEVSGVPFILDLDDHGDGGTATLHDAIALPFKKKARFSTVAMASVDENNPTGTINIGVHTGESKLMQVIFEKKDDVADEQKRRR